jgi:hypothetical protein
VELAERQVIFVGFKMDGSLRRRLDSLDGPEARYVSRTDSTFLRICSQGEALYVGKVVDEPLSTGRIDDVRRNVLSILQRLCPDERLPQEMGIWACEPPRDPATPAPPAHLDP